MESSQFPQLLEAPTFCINLLWFLTVDYKSWIVTPNINVCNL